MQCNKKHTDSCLVIFTFMLFVLIVPSVHGLADMPSVEMHGFTETRAGLRTQGDPHEKDISLMEVRLQGELFTHAEGGQVGPGIGNVEIAFYQSAHDKSGSNPRINNSEMRYLAGYTQDLVKDFNASLQYYVEYMSDYRAYRASLPSGPARDRQRHVITCQLTKFLMNQNLELTLSSYYSPTDNDAYLRPIMRYKYSDRMVFEGGANIFSGEKPHTFFGQFQKNTNICASVRYSF